MVIDLCDVKCKWINLDRDEGKNKQMEELVARLGMKNAERVSAVEGIEPHVGVRAGEEHYRSCAESHFLILQEAIENDRFPLLILEDDVEVEVFNQKIEVPDDADTIYLGTSHGDGNYTTTPVDDEWVKIEKVFATHAILYLNERYAKDVIATGKHFIYNRNTPFDVGCAYVVQPRFNVYAPRTPFFYQADSKNAKNKWEGITRTPLKMKPKKSVTQTIG